MASHHHHLRHRSTAASYCYCCRLYSPCHHHHSPLPPPPPAQPDWEPLYHYSPPPQPHIYSAQIHLPNSHQHHPHLQGSHLEEEIQTQHTIASLLRRIAALESALRGRSSSSNSLRDAAARTIQNHFRAFLLRRSRTLRQLKDLASIKSTLSSVKSSASKQTHLDYDVIYHQVMELVFKLDAVKGGDPMIRDGKSSLKRELINFLDFVNGFCSERRGRCLPSGVNIRYERSNTKNRFPNAGKKVGNVKRGGLRSVTMDRLRGLVERVDKLAEELDEEECEVIETPDVLVKELCRVQPKVKKSVSFADTGKVYRVLRRNSQPILDENDDDDDDYDSVDRVNSVSGDFEDDLCREVEEIGVASKEAEDDDEVEPHPGYGSNREKELRGYLRNEGNFERKIYNGVASKEAEDDDEVEAHSESGSNGEKELRGYRNDGTSERKIYYQGGAAGVAFSAPLPLKMETRADLVDKRKKLADDL